MKCNLVTLALFFTCLAKAMAQDSTLTSQQMVSSQFVRVVQARTTKLNERVQSQSSAALIKMYKQEKKVLKLICKGNSPMFTSKMTELDAQYQDLEVILKSPLESSYIGSLDTLTSIVSLLELKPELIEQFTDTKAQLTETIYGLKDLKLQFAKADRIQSFLSTRSAQLVEKLQTAHIFQKIGGVQKSAYYFRQQLVDWKATLTNHAKAESKAIELLKDTKVFKNFMSRHSQLAMLFPVPGGSDSLAPDLSGLQKRADVDHLLDSKITGGSEAARQQIKNNLKEARQEMVKIKALLPGGVNRPTSDPQLHFTPNSQRTKSFLKRLDWGVNYQSQRSSGLLPQSSDVGLSVGYKWNDRLVSGVGVAYRFGIGNDIKHLQVSHLGVGVRSFLDYNIKRSFWLNGGFELNHQDAFSRFEQLRNVSEWQQSAFLGLSKVISLRSKFFKKTKLQLMWDILSYWQTPHTQPVLFRYNYTF